MRLRKFAIAWLSAASIAVAVTGCSVVTNFEDCQVSADCGDGLVCSSDNICISDGVQTVKVAYLYGTGLEDHGWTKTHDVGREFLSNALADVETTFASSVAAEDARDVIARLISEGANDVVATSSAFKSAVEEVAPQFPETDFLMCAGFITGENLGSYFGRMYQSKWLAGRLAGHMTTSNRIGYVAPLAIPQTVRHVNAFAEGVRSINPDAVVMVRWINAFLDNEAEEAAANELLDSGVDVFHGSTNTPKTVTVVEQHAIDTGEVVYTMGYNNPNICELFGPTTCIASVYWNWGPMVVDEVAAIQDGTWDPLRNPWDNIKENRTDSVTHISALDPSVVGFDTQIDVDQFLGQFANGTFDAFEAVVADNLGNDRVVLGDNDMRQMCWYTPNVVEPGANEPFAPAEVPPSCVGVR